MRKHALLIGIDKYPKFPPQNQLLGCVADARLMASVLEGRFGFDRPGLLLDGEATRARMLQAFDKLVDRAGEDDIVVVHYSGHGSRMPDREGDEPDGYDETVVPCDSGRGEHPNHDISDDEIHHWLLRLTRKTPHVTLIFDSCRSATITRDDFGGRVRQVPVDRRGVDELAPSPLGPAADGRGPHGPSGWIHLAELGERYTLIAGCRDDEAACEHRPADQPGVVLGALTWFLARELLNAAPGTTWRDVFEQVAPRVTAAHPRQHPQLEGARDRELFGARDFAPMHFIPVLERSAATVRVGAGAAFGLTKGSRLAVYPAGTKKVGASTPRHGLLQVGEVGAVTSLAEVTEEAANDAVTPGARAVEEMHDYGEMKLVVELPADSSSNAALAELRRRIEASPLLRPAVEGETGRVRLYQLSPRAAVEPRDPVPQLGALAEPLWAVVGEDGELAGSPVRSRYPGAVDGLVDDLELRARYRNALALDNHDTESALRGKVELTLKRELPDGGWAPLSAEDGGVRIGREGWLLGMEVHNRWEREIYVAVLDFGLTGRISLVHPVPGANEPVPAGKILRIGTRPGEDRSFRLRLPKGLPSGQPRGGNEFIKIFATSHEADFSPLAQRAWRDAFAPGATGADSPLGRLLRTALSGRGVRGGVSTLESRAEDWTTVTRCFEVRPVQSDEER